MLGGVRPSPNRPRRPRIAGHFLVLGLVAALAGTSLQGCTSAGQKLLGAIDGPLNDPSNRTLRRSILAWGLDEFCGEMTSRNAPLVLAADSPVIGRFYPETCVKRELENGNLAVDFSGRGYAFTNLSKKMTFSSRASVQYNQDFLMDGSTMYAYFRTDKVVSSDFKIGLIEQPTANLLNSLSPVGESFGRQLLQGKLAEGFTVIREASGAAEFGLGTVPKGSRPFHPVDVHGADRVTYENARAEVHQNERDFVGPIKVKGGGRALYLRANLDGAAQADVIVLGASDGKASLELYLQYPAQGPMVGRPIVSETINAGVEYTRAVPVPEGMYYVVFDNTPTAGSSSPPMNAFDDRAATIRYAVQLGDAP